MRVVLALLLALLAPVTTLAASSTKIKITGESAKALYNAMKPDGSRAASTSWDGSKALLNGRVFCLQKNNRYTCEVAKNLEPFEVEHIYRHLDVKPLETNAFHRNVKIVGDILFMSSHNQDETVNTAMPSAQDNRIFFKHPCKDANTLTKARKCLQFWAKEIYEHYEAENDSLVVATNSETLTHFKNVLTLDNYSERALINTIHEAQSKKFIGAIGEYQDEIHVIYVSLSPSGVMAPNIINDMNTVDANWPALKEMFGTPRTSNPAAIKSYYVKKATCALLLGQKQTPRLGFDYVKDVVTDYVGYME